MANEMRLTSGEETSRNETSSGKSKNNKETIWNYKTTFDRISNGANSPGEFSIGTKINNESLIYTSPYSEYRNQLLNQNILYCDGPREFCFGTWRYKCAFLHDV